MAEEVKSKESFIRYVLSDQAEWLCKTHNFLFQLLKKIILM